MNLIIAGAVGFVIGAVIFGIIAISRKSKDSKDYSALKKEFDTYRSEVNAHFAKTADAVDNLTKSYKEVFNHLSDGAQHLMDDKALQAQLEKRQGKAVTLAYLVDEQDASADKRTSIDQQSVVNKPTDATKKSAAEAKSSEQAAPKPTEADASANKQSADQTKTAEAAKKDAPSKPATNADNAKKTSSSKPASADAEAKTEQPAKSNVHIAAEKAGLKPATKNTADPIKANEHETAVESVKKHINGNKS
ncbi:DUF1043 family protein [Suttonella sp. R2A3]|uniref:YhcB family protein n=1 Tax=Suttonella sp. R2A3 TaxID=2908648 RepID=UPI001F32A27F|nr:DUF1043 family protein [Suttonella sp. R2A3]UJF24271.1 DUF1043 family protein [Suttonella sp. R2A3]